MHCAMATSFAVARCLRCLLSAQYDETCTALKAIILIINHHIHTMIFLWRSGMKAERNADARAKRFFVAVFVSASDVVRNIS